MTALSDAQLYAAGLMTDEVLGFRECMKLRPSRRAEAVPIPDHFWNDGYAPRRRAFARGVEIAKSWRAMRTGAGIARREHRNHQFRNPPGAADPIDPTELRAEAWTYLLHAVGQADGFASAHEVLAHEIAAAGVPERGSIDLSGAVVIHDPEGPYGILVALHPASITHARRLILSAEALYQIQKFPRDPFIQDEIVAAADGRAAKAVARSHEHERTGLKTAFQKTKAMARAILILADRSSAFRQALLATEGHPIVEVLDTVSERSDTLWGALRTGPESADGSNLYGTVLTKVRDAISGGYRLAIHETSGQDVRVS